MLVKIHPFPAPGDNNMFLKLFYSQVNQRKRHDNLFQVEPISWMKILSAVQGDTKSSHVIHLHWEAVIYGSRFVIKSVGLMLVRFFMMWLLKRIFCVKICWTVHNFKSHDYPHPTIDKIGRKIIFALADGVIIQQKSVADEWHKKYPNKKIIYIPLGNYIGAYGQSSRGRSAMRREFYLKDDDLVIISFGTIKPYKNLELIIKTFQQNKELFNPKIKLLIIGKAAKSYGDQIHQLIGESRNIIFKNIFASDDQMADILEMADYSIFWYDDSTLTSGGLALSLSYGLPVIVRNIPAAEKITEGINGFLFDDAEQLAEVLIKLPETNHIEREQVVQSIVNDSWSILAEKYMSLYLSLFHANESK